MTRLIRAIQQIHNDERDHVEVGVPALIAGVGAVLLGIGAGGGGDVLAIIGGVVLGVGLFVASLLRHRQIDYDVWTRLDKLEK
jgi:H+/gluconate symporter-like permease